MVFPKGPVVTDFTPKCLILKLYRRQRTSIDRYVGIDALDVCALRIDIDAAGEPVGDEWLQSFPAISFSTSNRYTIARSDAGNLRAIEQPQPRADRPAVPDFLRIGVGPPAASIIAVIIRQWIVGVGAPIGAESDNDGRRQRLRFIDQIVRSLQEIERDGESADPLFLNAKISHPVFA